MQKPKYKRIMLKISGEALAGEKKLGLDTDTINEISRNIKEVYDLGVEIAIVVGVGISGEVEAGKEWTEPRRIIWACWQQLSMHWDFRMRLSPRVCLQEFKQPLKCGRAGF